MMPQLLFIISKLYIDTFYKTGTPRFLACALSHHPRRTCTPAHLHPHPRLHMSHYPLHPHLHPCAHFPRTPPCTHTLLMHTPPLPGTHTPCHSSAPRCFGMPSPLQRVLPFYITGGIQVSPNATRILHRWGLGLALTSVAVEHVVIVCLAPSPLSCACGTQCAHPGQWSWEWAQRRWHSHSNVTSLSATSTWERRGSHHRCGGQGMKDAQPGSQGSMWGAASKRTIYSCSSLVSEKMKKKKREKMHKLR